MGFSFDHFDMPIGDILFRQLCLWDLMGAVSDITRRYSLTENCMIFWLLQSFCHLFHDACLK